MLLEGAILGGITVLGLGVTYNRLPKGIKRFVINHPLLADTVLVVFFYHFMGFTIIAHIACATMVLSSQALFHLERNKAEYQPFYDLIGKGKEMMNQGLEGLKNIARGINGPQQQKVIDV